MAGEHREAQDAHHLHHAEQPQGAVDPQPNHQQAAQQAAENRRPQGRVLGHQADLGLAEAHVQVERRRQGGGHVVTDLVKKHEAQYQQQPGPAPPRQVLGEGRDHRLAQAGAGGQFGVRLAHQQGHGDSHRHERAGYPEHAGPGQDIREDQGQGTRHQAGNPVGLHVHGIAQAQFLVGENLPPEGIQGHILAGTEKRHRHRQPGDQPGGLGGLVHAQHAYAQQQGQLADQHPAPAPPQERRYPAIHQRRPDKFPGVGNTHQGEQADLSEGDTALLQPGGHQLEQHVQRHARGKAGEDTDQHAPVEYGVAPGVAGSTHL